MSLPLPDSVVGRDPDPDLAGARSGSVFAPLTHLGILQFGGEDAQVFLQGQLTCDVAGIETFRSTHGAYCSPKGRMLASFLLWREGADFFMALSRDLVDAIHTRILKFVLRSRVSVSDASESIFLHGLAGPKAEGAVRNLFRAAPDKPNLLSREDGIGTAIMLTDGRFVLASKASTVPALEQRLAAALERVDPRAWRWLDIRNGVPLVTAATQDRLVPQMTNLELLGGVSFTKGCYTGQEIVARTQHLGKVKRRMFLANVTAAAAAGEEIYCEDLGEQASGLVVNAEASPDGGCDLLAVVPSESRERSVVHLGSLGGPVLRFLALPYGAA